MLYLYSIFAGLIQGLTEFLPISSSGHLIIFHEFWNFKLTDTVAFDVALHLGTALAAIVYFRRRIFLYFNTFFGYFLKPSQRQSFTTELREIRLLIIGFIPAGIIGFVFESIVEDKLRSPWVVVITLTVVALLFFVVEAFSKQIKDWVQLSKKQSLLVGLAQAIALIPGVSRSGITIIAGLGLGLKRQSAAEFSFLISLPVILGAAVYKLLFWTSSINMRSELPSFVIGFIVSALIGFVAIKFFLVYLNKHSLKVFAWYRLLLAVILVAWLFLK